MAESEHNEHLTFPFHIEDDSVVSDAEGVGRHGAEPRKKPLWVPGPAPPALSPTEGLPTPDPGQVRGNMAGSR